MKAKRWNFLFALAVCSMLVTLVGCSQTDDTVEEETQTETVVVSKTNTNGYYRVALTSVDGKTQFTPSPSRGLLMRYLSSRQDVEAVEKGLTHLSMDQFKPETYYFQDGTNLEYDTLVSWLGQQLTPAELAKAVENNPNFIDNGLNPSSDVKVTTSEGVEIVPEYLAHILEQTYVTVDNNGTSTLGGISIGLSMTGCQYYASAEGYDRYHCYDDQTLIDQATKAADVITQYLRQEKGRVNVPIVFGIYKQAAATSSVPGKYIASTVVSAGETTVKNWENVNQEVLLLPSDAATTTIPEIANTFTSFQTQVSNYFPGNVGIVGYATMWGTNLEQLYVEINVSSRSYMEVVGLTQFLEAAVNERYTFNTNLEIVVKDGQTIRAVIEKNYDEIAQVNIING
ncbi:MAG: CamS family sex pheromone protein [Culicoidibacterales bacterium]